jgi:hypothetical protein
MFDLFVAAQTFSKMKIAFCLPPTGKEYFEERGVPVEAAVEAALSVLLQLKVARQVL